MQEERNGKDLMSLDGFCTVMKLEVQRTLGKGFKVERQKVLKTNGTNQEAILIKQEEENVSPTIYMQPYFERYCEMGDSSLDEIRDKIIMVYLKNKPKDKLDMEFFRCYEKVRPNICCRVINYRRNQQLLEQMPYIRIDELAIVFYYLFRSEELGEGIIQIYNNHMEMWNATIDDLVEAAKANMPILCGRSLMTMNMVIGAEEDIPIGNKSYVLTNASKCNGAVYMFDRVFMQEFADRLGKNLWIIPSSLHEVLIFPEDGRELPSEFNAMIREVNSTLDSTEILDDCVYRFFRDTGAIIRYGGMNCE